MQVDQLLNIDIPTLSDENTVQDGLHLMNELSLTELPLVASGDPTFILKEQELLAVEDGTQLLKHYKNRLRPAPVVLSQNHPYEAMRRMAEYHLIILPVVDEKGRYKGLITAKDLFQYFVGNSGLSFPGGVIILRLKLIDYSLSEIARICESSDVTILNTQIITHPESESISVVLKTNKEDLSVLKASFERFDYTIEQIFGSKSFNKDVMDRYNLLMNYINM